MAAHIEHISELPLAELIKSFLLETGNNLLVMFYAYPLLAKVGVRQAAQQELWLKTQMVFAATGTFTVTHTHDHSYQSLQTRNYHLPYMLIHSVEFCYQP